jgi:HK97 gp10 family phage protein
VAKLIITGIAELDKKLRELGPKVGNKVVRTAMRNAAKTLKAGIEGRAPEGETGALSSSVKVRAGKRSRTSQTVEVGLEDATFKGERFYAAANEWGTSEMPGQHFVRGTLDAEGESVKKDIEREIRDGIERVAKG